MLSVVLFVAAMGAPGAPTGQKPAGHRIYVFTADSPGGTTADERRLREDAVKELRDALAKKKGVTIVDDRGDADIRLEVVKCEAMDMGGGGFGGAAVTPFDQKVIHIHAVSPADQADFRGEAPGYWNRAAKDAADRLAKWIARQPPTR